MSRTTDQIKTHTLNYVIAAGVNPSVTVCFSSPTNVANQAAGCSGDVNQTGVDFRRGNLVTVEVTSRVPVIVGSFFGAGNWTVTGESTVLVNN